MGVVIAALQDFERDKIAEGDFARQYFGREFGRGGGFMAVKISDPDRAFDNRHNSRGAQPRRISSRSPSQPAPSKSRSASSCDFSRTTVRRASSTVARLHRRHDASPVKLLRMKAWMAAFAAITGRVKALRLQRRQLRRRSRRFPSQCLRPGGSGRISRFSRRLFRPRISPCSRRHAPRPARAAPHPRRIS